MASEEFRDIAELEQSARAALQRLGDVSPRVLGRLHAEDHEQIFWCQGGNHGPVEAEGLTMPPQVLKIKREMKLLGGNAPVQVDRNRTRVVDKAGLPIEFTLLLKALREEKVGRTGKLALVHEEVEVTESPQCEVAVYSYG
jgi:hypothetical protein